MTDKCHPRSDKFTAKDYLALGFSALALIISGAGFYFQFIEKNYALYVGISDARISLETSLQPAATFLFSNKGNQQAAVLALTAEI